VTVPEYQGRKFDAVLTRSAGAVDASSGTMLVELQIDNGDRALKPGAYAQVRFPLAAIGSVSIPSSALIVRDSGTQVAVLDATDHIHLRPVTIGRDNGATVEISSGLNASDRIVDVPPDAIAEGDKVRVQTATAAVGNSKG
jgi:multidrug efflux pump subunit AcrA (membrane-fusion protein)